LPHNGKLFLCFSDIITTFVGMIDDNPALALQLKSLSSEPGVYRYYDEKNALLYVGKAKNLKKRVLSYFNKTHEVKRTRIMVSRIHRLETTVVNSEYDALLLENNLIKEHQPIYNIMLKDDKTYPWICIKKEAFPRVFLTRNVYKDGSEYFGPYARPKQAYALMDLIKNLYTLRSCKLNLGPLHLAQNKYKVCLEYHIKNCAGACEWLETEANYMAKIEEIRTLLKGDFKALIQTLQDKMSAAAKILAFEDAHFYKTSIDNLQDYQAKSAIISPNDHDIDVFGMASDEVAAYVNFIKIRQGNIVQSYTTEIKKVLNEADEDILEMAVVEIRQRFGSESREVYLSFHLGIEIPGVKLIVPIKGDKKRLLELSEKNAKEYRIEKLKQAQIIDPERHTERLMMEMKKALHLPAEPRHIEGFDNSNIQGSHPVSACVVFKDGKPSKKDYRIFHIKTVEGPNDFASMEEVIYRRYKRMLEENEPLPQLILIDGGKGQLSSAQASLKKLGLEHKISMVSIAKRLEEIFFPNDSTPLYLDKKSECLKVLQRVRDEAHRFGVSHHRKWRTNSSLQSELEKIPGVGKKTVTLLLTKLKSVSRIKEASLEVLEEVLGKSKAKIVFDYFGQTPGEA
jgi:excinuclease ABC subunit C